MPVPRRRRRCTIVLRSHGKVVWFAQAKHESYYRHDPLRYRQAVGDLLTGTQTNELAHLGPHSAARLRQ